MNEILSALDSPKYLDGLIRLGFNPHHLGVELPKLIKRGKIRRTASGQYVKPKPPKDTKLLPNPKPHHACKHCGEWVYTAKAIFCSRPCRALSMVKPKPICLRCGTRVLDFNHKYCVEHRRGKA